MRLHQTLTRRGKNGNKDRNKPNHHNNGTKTAAPTARLYRRVSENSSLPGTSLARLNWPPISVAESNNVTLCPRDAAWVAKERPAGPAPTTATFLPVPDTGVSGNSVSWQAFGLTRHDARRMEKVWSRHAWLHPMHVLISSLRPSACQATPHHITACVAWVRARLLCW